MSSEQAWLLLVANIVSEVLSLVLGVWYMVNYIYLNNTCMKESSCIAAEEHFIENIYQECKYIISAEKSLKSDIWE